VNPGNVICMQAGSGVPAHSQLSLCTAAQHHYLPAAGVAPACMVYSAGVGMAV